MPRSEAPEIATLGALRASGHEYRTVKQELRENLLARLRAKDPSLPGLVGLEDTVVPEVERTLLAGHDLVLLGERGQGKTRLMRTIAGMLDEWTPVIDGSEINEHPYEPVTRGSILRAAQLGDELPITWWHRDDRYGEKLATPDTSVGDLIGDIDPTKIAEGRLLGDPETVHYGLLPRFNRGIFGINELPDLAERIQVGLFNVLEERDIQIRGYALRLPLDLLLIASANPEDYTNRGRIITPLKDRFGAEIRTHYPLELDDEIDVIEQEADLVASVPSFLIGILARFTRYLREHPSIDQRSGVSARFSIAGAETVAAAALHRATVVGEDIAVARPIDLESVVEVLRGKIEFESGEEGRELEILDYLLRKSTADAVRAELGGLDLRPLVDRLESGDAVLTGDRVPAAEVIAALGDDPATTGVLDDLAEKLGADDAERASALEFALEGLFLARRIGKEPDERGRTVYRVETQDDDS